MRSKPYSSINDSAKVPVLITSTLFALILTLIFSSIGPPTLLADQSDAGSANLAGPVYKSTDSGITWATISNGISGQIVNAFVMDPVTPETLYAGTNRGVFKSTDGGNRWELSAGFISLYRIHGLAVDPINPLNIYAVGAGHGGLISSKAPVRVISGNR